MTNRYRIQILLDAAEDDAAICLAECMAEAVRAVPGRVEVRIANLSRRKVIIDCLKWGGLIGLCAAGWVLYCVASGFWRSA